MAQKKKKTTKKEIERKKLQRQLAYYRNKYYDLGLKSEGFRRAITSSILDTERELKFLKTNLDFKSVFRGKYFNINGKKVYYEGIKAVKKQIDILKKQTSPNYKRDLFISNYARAMREQNFSNRNIKEVKDLLKTLNPKQLSYIIETGLLPQIALYYLESGDDREERKSVMNKIRNVVKNVKEDNKIDEIIAKGEVQYELIKIQKQKYRAIRKALRKKS